MSIDKILSKKSMSYDPIGDIVSNISQLTTQKTYSDENIGSMVIATESIDTNAVKQLETVYNGSESAIKSILSTLNIAVEDYQIESATIASMFSSNPKAFLKNEPKNIRPDAMIVSPAIVDGYATRPQISLEAYDDRENKNAQLYSIVYNLLASRQDDFGETFFPTVVINPNEVGVTLNVKLYYVYNDFKRSVTGSLANYARRNIIRAYADPDILRNELTRAVPVLRATGAADDNTASFVPVAQVPSFSVSVAAGTTVTTGALKVDTKIDLIGISQTNELIDSGIMGPSDTLDTYIKLENIYLSVTDGTNTDVIRLNTENLPGSIFTYAPQGNTRRMILSLDTNSVVLDSTTTNIAGAAPASLPELAANNARVQLSMNGSVVLDKGDCLVNRGTISLVALRDKVSGNLVTGAALTSLTAKLNNATILGYTLIAYRANSNIRQRGQLIDSQSEVRVIPIRYRSPLSFIMSSVGASVDDNTPLQTLINSTGIRVSNDAVTALLKAQTSLSGYNPVADSNGDLPEVADIGYFYVKPTYFSENIDLSLTVNNISSHEKIKDIRAALVEKIRYYANAMYRDSEYKAAASVLTGNVGFKPTIIVGTDVVLYNYIMADGDLRTLGDTFDIRVVSSIDSRVAGKIFISFGVFDSSRNTAVNPLNFGNMFWSPEMTVVMPVSRDGQVSKELIVAPRYLHNVNLPVLTVLNVTGLPTVTGKVAVNTHAV